ncbi:hypothetical protein GGH93_005991 [Coemansia aciculifera]|nr:hypothetical protein GGH93_005991 [Coemansia aciculifera]
MADESNSQLVDALLTLGREKAYAEIGQMLTGLGEGVLYSLVEEDLGTLVAGDVSLSPVFQITTLVFKGGCALVEKGAAQAGESILGAVTSACVSQICEDDPKDERDSSGGKKWSTISDKLLEVLPQLSSRSIIDVAFRILAELKACGSIPSPLHSFLPMLLDTLGTIGPVEIVTKGEGFGASSSAASGDSTITRTGLALKSYWVEAACSYRWDPKSSVAVCALLREIVLSERQIEVVAYRMLRQLKLVELNELPAMVYQLLLFARNGFKREIIGGILSFFDTLENDSSTDGNTAAQSQKRWRELGDIEGTVMLHIIYNIKQDFELGDALIAHAKEQGDVALAAADGAPSTFSFACLLALARIHRFEDAVVSFLRTTIVKSIHDAMALASTAWIRPHLPPIQLSAQQQLLSAVVARSSYGWDQVTQSLIQLCLSVMDLTGSAAARRSAYSAQACAEARRISTQALRSAFGGHEFVRAEVVDQILSRVMFQTDSHMHFLALLGDLVSDDSDVLRVFVPKFVDVFDSISVISPAALERLLVAISPIILDDAPFRSSLILVLRKILFAHSFDDRRTALSGLFVLTSSFASALDECQVRLGAAALAATGAGEVRHLQRRVDVLVSALLEVLGLLRRCLTQQPEVRAASYERLGLLLDMPCVRGNSLLLSALHDIFRVEFAKYYRAPSQSQGCSPINIQLCLHPVTNKVVMPIASFLHCYGKLVVASRTPGFGASSLPSSSGLPAAAVAAKAWRDLCLRFAKAQIEDFELDPTGDYSLDSQFGQRNFSTARLAVGCLDACVGYALAHIIHVAPATAIADEDSDAASSGNLADPTIVVELFTKFSRFGDILSSRCIDERKKRIIPSISDLSLLSLDSIATVLRLVLPDKQRVENGSHPLNLDPVTDHSWFVSHMGKAGLWSANQPLVKHLLEVALARIQRRPVAGNFMSTNNSPAVLPPAPDARALLEMAYVVFSGVLVYFGDSDQAADAEQSQRPLPVYLRTKAARGRGIVHISAEILLACMTQLTSTAGAGSDSLDRLAVAIVRPAPERFTDNVSLPSNVAVECVAALLTSLRRAVTTLLRLKPMAVKDASTVLSSVQILTTRLSELAFSGTRREDQVLAYQCLHQTAKWTVELVQGEMPNDLGLMKSLVVQLTSCQAFLQPESTVIGTTTAVPVAVGRRSDEVELEPVDQLTARMCAASRLHIRDPDNFDDEDEDIDERELEKFTVRSIPALASLIMSWLKAELHRVDWAIGQLRRSVSMELNQRSGTDDGGDVDLPLSIGVERRICRRMCALSHVLEQLLSGSLPKAMYDLVIRAFQELHRTWALLTRAKMASVQLPITESYIDALSLICSDLNTHAYALITNKYSNMIGNDNAEDVTEQPQLSGIKKLAGGKDEKGIKGSKPKPKSKVMRDSSLVSSLVYQMELSEKYVIQLSTKFKTPLAHYLKRSTVRDFRIKKSDIPEAMVIASDDDGVHMHDSVSPVQQQHPQLVEDAEDDDDEEDGEEEDVAVSDVESDTEELVSDLPGYSSSEDTADIRGKRARLD